MSVNIMLGINGSGKSYESTVYHVLPALKRGRKVITNLPLNVEAFGEIDPDLVDLIEIRTKPQLIKGSFDSTREGSAYLVEDENEWRAPERGAKAFSGVWDYYTTWRHPETGMGPLYVIDECHNALPRMGTARDVEDWYAIHRHFNCDVLLITQSYGKVNEAIRDLVKVCYKVRKATALGSEKKYIRRVLDGIRGSEIDDSVREYKPQYYPLYRSHTQGMAVEEAGPDDVKSKILTFRKWTRYILIIGALVSLWSFYKIYTKPDPVVNIQKMASSSKKRESKYQRISHEEYMQSRVDSPVVAAVSSPGRAGESSSVSVAPGVPGAGEGSPGVGASGEASPARDSANPEPYGAKGMHMSGCLTMRGKTTCIVTVSQNGAVLNSVTSDDLERIGYRFERRTDCAALIHWQDRARAITCDLPQVGLTLGGLPRSATQPERTAAAPIEPPKFEYIP